MFVTILPQNANLINDLCFLYDSINVTRDEQVYLQSNKNTTFYNKNLFTKDRKDRKKNDQLSIYNPSLSASKQNTYYANIIKYFTYSFQCELKSVPNTYSKKYIYSILLYLLGIHIILSGKKCKT